MTDIEKFGMKLNDISYKVLSFFPLELKRELTYHPSQPAIDSM